MTADPSILAILAEKVPVALAMAAVVWLFLRHLREKEDRTAKAFREKDEMIAKAYAGKDRRRNGGD